MVVSCSNKYQKIQNTEDDYQIIPKPQKLIIAEGRFLLNSNTKIICTKSLEQEAAYLSNMLSSRLGFDLTIDSSANARRNITLKLDPTIENTEGYKLSVEYDAVVISGKTTAGIFYGIQSLRQLLPAEIENDVNDIEELNSGEIGFIITGIKSLSETKVGDTICDASNPIVNPLPGYKPSKPVVFCGLFPVDSSEYQKLKDGLGKLKLNDASFSYEAESSTALGLGFRCGFLGLLHLEIITERLEREFDVNLITTTPGVIYKVHKIKGDVMDLQNPSNMPDPTQITKIEEPWINATIITPDEYLGSIIKICQDKRGVQTNLTYSGSRAVLSYDLPLNEVVFDFNDRLKSVSSGYASFDYEITGHKEGDLVKLGILVNTEPVDALAMIIHKDFAQKTGRQVCEKLKDLIPRHNFMIPIQAAIGGKIVARESIKGFSKDVLTKIHGGGAADRKKKLLKKQKKGKARSKQFGRVEIPQEAFIGVLKINKES